MMKKSLLIVIAGLLLVGGCQYHGRQALKAPPMAEWPEAPLAKKQQANQADKSIEPQQPIATTEEQEDIDAALATNQGEIERQEVTEQEIVVEEIPEEILYGDAVAGQLVKLEISAPEKVVREKQLQYTISLKNEGVASLSDLTVKSKIDKAKVVYVSSVPQAEHLKEKGILVWDIQNLAPSEIREIKLTVLATGEGEIVNQTLVRNRTKVIMRKQLVTPIQQSVGLQIDHSDTNDPVEVNSETTYVIEIRNRGIKNAQNILVRNTIPEESIFVSAAVSGLKQSISYQVEGNEVIFDPIEFLALGETVTFQVTVQALKAGDLLNTCRIKSDDFGKVLTSQEPTKAVQQAN